MDNKLYPLKFKNIFKEVIWGGEKLAQALGKNLDGRTNIGESWEISCVKDNVSVVADGFLAGNELDELIEVYMGELVGDAVFEEFGTEFPLLIKFIDANDALSIQVHPNDEQAKERHNSRGKTEMWYVVAADEGAELVAGFKETTTKETYTQKLADGQIQDLINVEPVKAGDVFFIPAGRIHAIGKGMLVAEIQETSNITYRIYDWDRTDADGKGRELHTEQAVDVLEYKRPESFKTDYHAEVNTPVNLADCQYFTTNLLEFTTRVERDYVTLDSFVIHMCLEGAYDLYYEGVQEPISLKKGETVLIPASLNSTILQPNSTAKILEVYIKNK